MKTFHSKRPDRRKRKARYAARRMGGVLLLLAIGGAIAAGDYFGLFGFSPGQDYPRYHGREVRVTHVVDGDTLDVDLYDPLNDDSETRIRLWGVDTPETVKPNTPPQHFGPEATAATRRWCKGKTVTLELVKGDTRGKYKRLLAYVVLPDGETLNARLVRKGLAYADPRFEHPRREEYLRLQAIAVRDRAGLWKDVTPADLPYYFQGRLPDPAPPQDANEIGHRVKPGVTHRTRNAAAHTPAAGAGRALARLGPVGPRT